MSTVQLIFGARHIDRPLPAADRLMLKYREDTGCDYLDHRPCTPPDLLVPEDLAITLSVNSQAGWRAVRSLQQHGGEIDLRALPDKPLKDTSPEERRRVAELIAQMAQWPGFAASLSTKVLHKKRPALIPILDNQAIFGAYMDPDWPGKPAPTDSEKRLERIREALEWIAFDLGRPENTNAWPALLAIEAHRTRIQLFDSVWWIHFRTTQPVREAAKKEPQPHMPQQSEE
jgi:hypothetical protein